MLRLVHLAICAAALVALVVWAGCGPTCVTECGVTYDGTDCAGFGRIVSATVAAYPGCDAGTEEDACASLVGYRVHVLPVSETQVDDAGRRYWPAPENGEGVTRAYGETDCAARTITLAEERPDVAAWELVNASQGYCPMLAYPWPAPLSCVYQHGRAASVALTGAAGGSP